MVERRNTRRNLLVVVAVVALFVSAAGVVAFAQGGEGEVFTGCVNQNSGVLKSVAVGSEPAKPCNRQEVEITWDRAGPAFEGRIAELERRVAELEEPFGTLDLFVDCDAGETVGAALADAETHLGPVDITISGVCEESIFVGRDNVSFRGTHRSDGIRAASPGAPAVGMFENRGVRFNNLTISGGSFGISADLGSTFVASDITVRDTSQAGISVREGSNASVVSCAIVDNSKFGVTADTEGSILLGDCEITDNGAIGVFAGGVGSATARVSDSHVARNGRLGLATGSGGNVGIQSSTVEHNPEGGVLNGGELRIFSGEGGPTRIADNGFGVRFGGGSSGGIGQVVIEGNFVGISVGEGSHAGVSNAIVRDNTEDGIRILDLSTVFVGSETQILDNGHWGIFCGGPPAIAVRGGQVRYLSETVFSGNGLGDTNCE